MPDKNITSELSQISKLLASITPSTPYNVPAGYFQTLADDILHRINAGSTINDLSFLQLNEQQKNLFHVPAGYFNNLAGTILDRIKASEARTPREETGILSPLLSAIDKKMPLSIPENYFEELKAPVMAGLNGTQLADDAEQIPSFLQSVKNNPTYQPPAGYFDQLAGTVLEQVQPAVKAKVIPLQFSKKILRYAAAASIAGIMAVGGWVILHKPAVNSAGGDLAGIQNISNKELQDFVDKNTFILPESSTASNDINAEDVKTMFAGVSDEELQQYLDQQPNLKDPVSNNFN